MLKSDLRTTTWATDTSNHGDQNYLPQLQAGHARTGKHGWQKRPLQGLPAHPHRAQVGGGQFASGRGRQTAAARPCQATNAAASAPSADVEAEAAALFADESKSAEPVETKLIDLNCPFCDEPIHFPLDLAGKRAPCPECKNILKVPEPAKKDPKDWRRMETRGPSGARLPDQPEPEGAWGSTTVRGVGKESLEQAGVLPKKELPRTWWQKVRWPVLGVSLVLVLCIGGWMGYRWWGQRAADRALAEALAFAATPEAKPPVQAALFIGAGEYYLHSPRRRMLILPAWAPTFSSARR